MDVVELLRQMSRQAPAAVAREEQSRAAPQHAFVGRHPLDAHAVRDGQRLVRNAAFRRPYALRDAVRKLFRADRVRASSCSRASSGWRNRFCGRGKPRRRHRAGIRVAHQRQNRVIERRRRKLDRSFLRRLGMRRQHSAQQFPFPRNHKLLIVERVAVPLGHQRRDVFLFQKEFVEPRNLRQDLQVGEILRLKISLRALRMVAMLAKALPQLAVARIAPDHVLRIRLKQILQREAPLLHATRSLAGLDATLRNGSCAVPAT